MKLAGVDMGGKVIRQKTRNPFLPEAEAIAAKAVKFYEDLPDGSIAEEKPFVEQMSELIDFTTRHQQLYTLLASEGGRDLLAFLMAYERRLTEELVKPGNRDNDMMMRGAIWAIRCILDGLESVSNAIQTTQETQTRFSDFKMRLHRLRTKLRVGG